MKYTDRYVGKVIDFLRTHMPNTIVAITGDHGARNAPYTLTAPSPTSDAR